MNSTRLKNAVLLLLPFLLLLAVICGCDAWANFDGKVTDEAGKPLAAVKIVVKQGDHKFSENVTDKTGEIHAGGSICPLPGCPSDISIEFSKDGYDAVVRKFDWYKQGEPMKHLVIVLTRSAAASPPAG